ncbi:MAG: DUF2206 domain-containing protein [Nitrososphaerota archaeon]|nr:DUF2206 domain-containing protein [Nitrososphaerota archaeon]
MDPSTIAVNPSNQQPVAKLSKQALLIPFITLVAFIVLLLDISVIREIVLFAYLSFVPGFVTLKVFRLKKLNLLHTFLLSVGLSLFVLMFVGFLVNGLCLFLGFMQPLSAIPLMVALSSYVLVVFFIDYRHDFSIDFASLHEGLKVSRKYLHIIPLLIVLPITSVLVVLYVNVPLMLGLTLIIAIMCIFCAVSTKFVPRESYPFLILSISLSILLLNLLISKYTIGDDASLEFYVFKVTQLRGYWAPLDAVKDTWQAVSYNSNLSVTVLPAVYSALMNVKNELLFKILYPFIFSLLPLGLYEIYKKEHGALIALLAALFFVFSVNAFFGELISVNRQIVAEFFLVLSLFLWLDKGIPLKEKRLLLIIFGLSISLAHYSLAVIYIIFVSLVVLVSSVKPAFDKIFNSFSVVTLFGITFIWYAFGPGSSLGSIIRVAQSMIDGLTSFQGTYAGSASNVYAVPEVFTVASWINLAVTGAVTFALAAGVVILLLSKKLKLPDQISDKYMFVILLGGLLLGASYALPRFAAVLNFTRFYAITLLVLSPCLVVGLLYIFKVPEIIIRRITARQKISWTFSNRSRKTGLLLVAILLSAFFLSQSGFINHATGGAFRTPSFGFDYYRLEASNSTEGQLIFYSNYIQDPDAFSAYWLYNYWNISQRIYADSTAGMHVMISCALVPQNLIYQLTNETIPERGSFI